MYLATIMLLGSGELGREFTISAKRLGCRVIACDRYDNAPAMQLADEREVLPMLDGAKLRAAVEKYRPDYIVPEIEAIDTATLAELEREGWKIVPSAKAVQLTMNRDGIREYAARELGLTTSRYLFAETREEATRQLSAMGDRLSARHVRTLVNLARYGEESWEEFEYREHHCTWWRYTSVKYYSGEVLRSASSPYIDVNLTRLGAKCHAEGTRLERHTDPGWI